MIQVTIGNNLNRSKVVINSDTTLRTALDDAELDYAMAQLHLDGATLKAGDLDKTFADFGITTSCFLIAVVKTDNA
jgi:hypothetical protein